MTRLRKSAVILLAVGAAALVVTACGGSSSSSSTSSSTTSSSSKKPIIIGAAIDLSNTMKFFDGPAEAAARIEVNKINAQGGVDGRKLEFLVENDQLNPSRTRADALDLPQILDGHGAFGGVILPKPGGPKTRRRAWGDE